MSKNIIPNELSDIHKLDGNCDTPFIHRFETNTTKYIYDVCTMHIIRVDQIIWDIIPNVGLHDKTSIISKYSDKYDAGEISRAYDEIIEAQKERYLFLSKRPKEISIQYTEKYLSEKLSSERKQLILYVTEDCNFQCSYCFYAQNNSAFHPFSPRYMEWNVAKKAIDDYLPHADKKRQAISFYGGEPLLNIDLIRKCITYVKEFYNNKDVLFSMTTNGSLLKGEAADFLANNNVMLRISLDGPQSNHDRHRVYKNGSPSWDTVVSNVRNFLEKYPQYKESSKLSFNMVAVPPVEIAEFERFIESIDIINIGCSISINPVNTRFLEHPFEGRIEGMQEMYQKYKNNLEDGAFNFNREQTPQLKTQAALFERPWVNFHKRHSLFARCSKDGVGFPEKFCALSVCLPGTRRTYVSVDGGYWPCERVPESNHLKIGDIENGFDVPRIKQLLDEWVEFTKKECKYCWALSTCQVGCWSNVCDGKKPTATLKKKECTKLLHRLHQSLVDYSSVLEKNPKALDYLEKVTII